MRFSEALEAALTGVAIRSPTGLNKWIELRKTGTGQNRLMHWSEYYGWLTWLPNQTELLADDWETYRDFLLD